MMTHSRTGKAILFGVTVAIAALLIASFVSAQDESYLERLTEGEIETLSLSVDSFRVSANFNDAQWQRTFRRDGSGFLRVRFSNFANPDDESFSLVVKDASGVAVAEYTADTLPSDDFWTPVIFGDELLVQVYAPGALQSLSFEIEEFAFQTRRGLLDRVLDAVAGWFGTYDLEPITKYSDDDLIWGVSRAVAKLSIVKKLSEEESRLIPCTGFLIRDELLMTNQHCVEIDTTCENTQAIFGYDEYQSADIEQYSCKRVVAEDFETDFALLELEGSPGEKWGTLQPVDQAIDDDEKIFIVQHPNGEPKQIAIENCNVAGAIVDGYGTDTDMAHTCDTRIGSSGSPVFLPIGAVIGLHHREPDEQGEFAEKNRAVRMKLILEELGPLP